MKYRKPQIDVYDAAADILGHPGAMLSGSKRHPPGTEDHTIFWNACVFQKVSRKDAIQIWWGDLDVTDKQDQLQQLANTLRTTIYATPEQPFRFDGFKEAMKSYAAERVVRFDPS